MSALVQISDTHFGTEQPIVVEALLQLVAAVRPELVVLSGDVTQRARRHQFAAARIFCDNLQTPSLLTLPGNHDIPLFNFAARLFSPYGNYRRAFGFELEPYYESREFLVIGVNTTRPHRHVDGEISDEQVRRVAGQLAAGPADRICIVVTHQPVHVIKDKDEKNVLRGNEPAVRAWAAAGADVIMGGHIHLPYVRPLSERFSDLPRRVWAVQAGTAVSCRVRHSAPNSVNVVRRMRQQPLTYAAERWDYNAERTQFLLVDTQLLELDRSDQTRAATHRTAWEGSSGAS
ncbi:MAG TPA: metallophosphoesterase [Povalibacter sp.]